MRIVAGIYGGRRLETPKGRDIRPTSDKVRGSIFNALQSRGAVEGAHLLDVFCGSGALGLEALSRGAAHCTFIDKARESVQLTRANVEMLGAADESQVIQMDATKSGQRPAQMTQGVGGVDLALLDPPYGKGLADKALECLRAGGWLADGALCVIEESSSYDSPAIDGFEVLDQKIYGDTKVIFMRYQAIMPE